MSLEEQERLDCADLPICQSIEWYAEGQIRVVEVDGVRVEVHVIGRKGRRTRIEIMAPAGAVFRSYRADEKLARKDSETRR
jgi:hypothetical protein